MRRCSVCMSNLHAIEPLIAIRMQFVSKCSFPHNRSNTIICNSPSVCDNQDSGGTQRATNLKIWTQAHMDNMLIPIENCLYRFPRTGTSHIYTSEFWESGNMQRPNNRKIDIYAYIDIYILNVISEIYLYRSTEAWKLP